MTADVFVNYRRLDSGGFTGRLFDGLAKRFGRERIFFDVDSIDSGAEFPRHVAESLSTCRMLLVVIGRSWLTVVDATGKPRLDDPNDLVRREIEAALRRGIVVIPVLADGASMPEAQELPESLKALADRNAAQLRHERFDDDLIYLSRAVAKALKRSATTPVPDGLVSFFRRSYTLRSPCSSAELSSASMIAAQFFSDENIDASIIRKIHEKSPNSFLVITEGQSRNVIGYTDLFAVRQERLERFEQGTLAEHDFALQDFLPLNSQLPEQGFNLYIGGIAVEEKHRWFERSKCAALLVYGLMFIALQTAFKRNVSRRFYAVALSVQGGDLLRHFGFSVIKDHRDRVGNGDLYCRIMHRLELESELKEVESTRHMANFDIRMVNSS